MGPLLENLLFKPEKGPLVLTALTDLNIGNPVFTWSSSFAAVWTLLEIDNKCDNEGLSQNSTLERFFLDSQRDSDPPGVWLCVEEAVINNVNTMTLETSETLQTKLKEFW